MKSDDWNQMAIQGLLADAERALALTEVDDVRGNRQIVRDAITSAHQIYIDLVRRSRRLILGDGEQVTLQDMLDSLRAKLHFFGVSI